MESINDRISRVVAHSGRTKTDFGKDINLSQSMVSKLCTGSALPSDRTISDICRVFNINETWLRTGSGDMIDYPARKKTMEDTVIGIGECLAPILGNDLLNEISQEEFIESIYKLTPSEVGKIVGDKIVREIYKRELETKAKKPPQD